MPSVSASATLRAMNLRIEIIHFNIVYEGSMDLLDRFNGGDNSNVRVDRACQNCVYAAVCADIDETAGALEVIENYRRSLSFPLSQAGPEYPMANGVKFGGNHRHLQLGPKMVNGSSTHLHGRYRRSSGYPPPRWHAQVIAPRSGWRRSGRRRALSTARARFN